MIESNHGGDSGFRILEFGFASMLRGFVLPGWCIIVDMRSLPVLRRLPFAHMHPLILASGSVHRLALLREAGYDVEAIPPGIVESELSCCDDLEAGLREIARAKAEAVAERGASGLILAADTVGRVAGRVFGKP